MHKEVIADASVLIVFDKLGITDLLCKHYNSILIPGTVYNEYQGTIENCFKIIDASSQTSKKLHTESSLGLGECEVIMYAKENNTIALIDDKKARRTAYSFGITFTGTIGILARLRNENIITDASQYGMKLKNIGFRISDELIEFLKKQS